MVHWTIILNNNNHFGVKGCFQTSHLWWLCDLTHECTGWPWTSHPLSILPAKSRWQFHATMCKSTFCTAAQVAMHTHSSGGNTGYLASQCECAASCVCFCFTLQYPWTILVLMWMSDCCSCGRESRENLINPMSRMVNVGLSNVQCAWWWFWGSTVRDPEMQCPVSGALGGKPCTGTLHLPPVVQWALLVPSAQRV